MTEEIRQDEAKPRYEAPELLSLGETVRGIAICEDGSTPSGVEEDCTDGFDAYESCSTGEYAWHECIYGDLF